jgi:hypothetical protein
MLRDKTRPGAFRTISIRRCRVVAVTALVATLLCTRPCSADFVEVYDTPSGSSTGGQPVNTQATFTDVGNTLTVTLNNLQANPTSVVQALSGLFFTFNTGQTSGTLSSSSGTERTIAGNGTYTDGSAVSTGWLVQNNVSGGLGLNVLGGAGPAHLIIGPPGSGGVYSNANSSIAGNGPHNPFLDQSATFTLTVPGLTSSSRINGVTFAFGTTAGTNNVAGVVVPEPASLVLFGLGIGCLGLMALRRQYAARAALV